MKNFDTQCLIYEIDQNSNPKLESLSIFQNSTKEKWNSSNPNQTKKTHVSENPNRNPIPIFYNLQQQTIPTKIPQKLTHTQRHKPKKIHNNNNNNNKNHHKIKTTHKRLQESKKESSFRKLTDNTGSLRAHLSHS